MNASNHVEDLVLERQGKRMIGRAVRLLAITAVLAVPEGSSRERLVFEVTDRELHHGVLAVLRFDCL